VAEILKEAGVTKGALGFFRQSDLEKIGCRSWARIPTLGPMRAESPLLNVIDVEATCWDGQPPPGSVSEIIEIGLTVVDVSARSRVSRHRLLVRPVRSAVSGFCTELTGLTQAEVERGVTFAEACRILVEEYGAGERCWASWGEYDRR
jgi:inhibitor of KinA sporulation pathway (predicted exonuclease)